MLNQYARAISANYFFWTVNTVFFIIITPVAIRVMGPQLFGLWSILNAILLFSSIGTLGMDVVITKFGSEEGTEAFDRDAILSAGAVLLLPMAVLVALSLVALRGPIVRNLHIQGPQQELFSLALVLAAVGMLPLFMSRALQGYLYSQLRYDLGRSVESVASITLWVGAVLIAWRDRNVAWMAAWGLAVQAMSWGAYLWLVTRKAHLRWKWEPSAFRRMSGFSFFTLIQSTAVALYQNFDRILVGFVLGPAIAGVYAVGTSVGLRLSIVTGQVTQLMVPYASRKASILDQDGLYSTFCVVSRLVNLLLMALSSVLVLWLDMILSVWISPEYAKSFTHVFQVLIVAYLLLSAARPAHQTLVGMGHVRFTSLTYLGSTTVMLVSLRIWGIKWGLIGVAAANLWMVLLLSFVAVAHRVISGRVPWWRLTREVGTLLTFPLLSCGLVNMVEPQPWLRVGATAIVLTVAVVSVWRDAAVWGQVRATAAALYAKWPS